MDPTPFAQLVMDINAAASTAARATRNAQDLNVPRLIVDRLAQATAALAAVKDAIAKRCEDLEPFPH